MNNFQVQILVVFLITVNLLISSVEISYAQNSTENELSAERLVLISKTASSNTIISNGSSSVGGFSNTYMITGNAADIKNSKELILETVTNDFTNSSTVGYVILNNGSETNDITQIANPFASNEQISQKIKEELNRTISEASMNESNLTSITCQFGNSLDLFSCSVIPMLK
jgi:hypothetical protein